jgi:NAD(P)-dependent dehydrogenase (short-subunit alcohol dehydrogenase family)
MATICITGSSDGIGLATARVLLADGHRVLIHARSRDRGRPVLEQLGGEAALVTGDLAQLDEVHRLADQIHAHGPVDALVHNAGVWVRGSTPRTTVDELETTFAVNVLAAHLLTHLLAADLGGRLLWLGSGMATSGRPDPATLGRRQEPSRAYADSKACDLALALAWGLPAPDGSVGRRRPGLGEDQTGQRRRSRQCDIVRGHPRLLLHRRRSGVRPLLEEPGTNASSATPEGRDDARRDRLGMRSAGGDRLTALGVPSFRQPSPRRVRAG